MRNVIPIAVAVALLALAGCSAGDAPSMGSYDAPATSAAEAPHDATDSVAGESGGYLSPSDRYTIVTGTIGIEAEDPIRAGAKVVALVEKSGGRVDSRTEHQGSVHSDPSAQLTIRVPSDAVSTVVDSLADVGAVTSVDLGAEDVTSTVVDLDARITQAQASVDRLQTLLAQTGSVADLLSVETQLSERQSTLESLKAQRSAIGDQIDYSSIDVFIDVPPKTAIDDASQLPGFLGGVADGWQAMYSVGATGVSILGILTPWLAVAAVLVVAIWAVVRTRRRRVTAAAVVAPEPAARMPAATSTDAAGPTTSARTEPAPAVDSGADENGGEDNQS